MTLTQAKHLADKLSKGHGLGAYTTDDALQAIRLLERTNRGSKTQNAWDRLARRLNALRSVGAARAA